MGTTPSSDLTAIARALETLLNTTPWDAKRAVLEREKGLLLTESAIALLAQQIEDAQKRGEGQEELFMPMILQSLLTRARERGIDTVWEEISEPIHKTERALKDSTFLAEILNIPAKDVKAFSPVFVIMQKRLRQMLREREQPGGESPIPYWDEPISSGLQSLLQQIRQTQEVVHKIDLLQEALHHIEEGEGNAVLWASLKASLGVAFHNLHTGDRADNIIRSIASYEAALQVYTCEDYPQESANTIVGLCNSYRDQLSGTQGEKWERMIALCEAASQVLTPESYPQEWASIQHTLGSAYVDRTRGNPSDNLHQALSHFTNALQVYTREAYPHNWARIQIDTGYAYSKQNEIHDIDQALAAYEAALQVCTYEEYPEAWADIQARLPLVYIMKVTKENYVEIFEQAIAASQASLRVYRQDTFPEKWAASLVGIATAHMLMAGLANEDRVRKENKEKAIAYQKAALRVYTPHAYPFHHRHIARMLALLETGFQHWEEVHNALASAQIAEDLLLSMGTDLRGSDEIIADGWGVVPGIADGIALARLGRFDEAATATEQARARGLAESRNLNGADPNRIQDAQRRQRFIEARQHLIETQKKLYLPLPRDLSESERRTLELACLDAFRQAKELFNAVVNDVRNARDPSDFFQRGLDSKAILQVAKRVLAGHALVYLTSSNEGGVAIAAISGDPSSGREDRFVALDLIELTDDFVRNLAQTLLDEFKDSDHIITGGFLHAQEGNGINILLQNWPGMTFTERATRFHTSIIQTNTSSTLDLAVQELLCTSSLQSLVTQPLHTLEHAEIAILATTLGDIFLQRELHLCLPKLAEVALRPLVDWLKKEGVSSMTLIPCGALAIFPLLAIPLNNADDPAYWHTVADALPSSIAPSARSLLHDDHDTLWKRSGVYALGDPWPTHQPLRWGEAEAQTLATLGGNPAYVAVHYGATRTQLIDALNHAQVVDAACHGQFDVQDFLQSRLLLANNESLSLSDMLSGVADLRGLRLLILSACQTAILHLRGASDEVQSLAVGMLQAGAVAVLGALWAVDDRATYLLMVRFAQEWFPNMDCEPPAAALARAQKWLRTVTNRELRQWEAITLLPLTGRPPLEEPGEEQLGTVRGRGYRYTPADAQKYVQGLARRKSDDVRPYADPIFWAAFQITGW